MARGKCRDEHYLAMVLTGLAAFSAPMFLWVKIRYGHHLVASKYDIAAFSVHLGTKHFYFLLHSLGPGKKWANLVTLIFESFAIHMQRIKAS